MLFYTILVLFFPALNAFDGFYDNVSDTVIDSLNEYISMGGFSSFSLPDKYLDYWIFQISLTEGMIGNFSTIKRQSSPIVRIKGDNLSFNINVGFQEVSTNYKLSWRLFGIKEKSVFISFALPKNRFQVEGSIQNLTKSKKDCKAKWERAKLVDLGHLEILAEPIGVFVFFFSKFVQMVYLFIIKGKVFHILDGMVEEVIADVISQEDFSRILCANVPSTVL